MAELSKDYPGRSFRESLEKAVAQFEQAIKYHPNDASAYVRLADSYTMLWCFGFIPHRESFPKIKAAAVRAVELDDNLGVAHTTLGIVKLSGWDWAGAEQEFKCAVELNPSEPKSRHWYALYLAAMGRHEQAIAESRRAVALDSSPSYKVGLASILYFARDFEQMAELIEKVIAKAPNFASAYDWLGMAYVQLKKYEEAIVIYQKAVALAEGAAEVKSGLGHAYGVAGREVEARAVLDELNALSMLWYVPPVQIAFVYVGLGERDRAFELLEKAYKERSWELVFIREEPWFDDLHSDPRFVDLLRRMHFPDKTDS